MVGVGAAAATGEGQVAVTVCSEALAEADLPKDYCCLQAALLTHLIVVICTSHAEWSCTQAFSFSPFITERFVILESFFSQSAPTRATRPLGQNQLSSIQALKRVRCQVALAK